MYQYGGSFPTYYKRPTQTTGDERTQFFEFFNSVITIGCYNIIESFLLHFHLI